MTSTITKTGSSQREAEPAPQLFDDWFDPIETEVRDRARGFIEELIPGELDAVLARPRYVRSRKGDAEGAAGVTGHRHGSRRRSLTGTFGPIEMAVPHSSSLEPNHTGSAVRSVAGHSTSSIPTYGLAAVRDNGA